MNKTWMINTRGNPLESLHQFISDVWQAAELDYVYLPLKIPEEPYIQASLINDPARLAGGALHVRDDDFGRPGDRALSLPERRVPARLARHPG